MYYEITVMDYDIMCNIIVNIINHIIAMISYACDVLWYHNPVYDIISKPGYPYDTIMTFWINYTHYDTIMTLLLHLWHLQKSDYYDTLWQKPGKDYYYTYDITIIAIMTF